MVRKFVQKVETNAYVTDVLCDSCGKSCRSVFNPEKYEYAGILADFNEGPHAGDRWRIQLCQKCFFDFVQELLVKKLGTAEYDSVIDPVPSTIDELRTFFAHRAEGDVPDEFC